MTNTAPASPSWAAESIWWQVYPLGFTGALTAGPPAESPAGHHLRRLERWLAYAADIGCSGLLLGPIFAAETHGYDTIDHFRIDPRLGDDADFDALAAAARQRGLPIVLDGVFNHVGRGFTMFTRALADGPDSAAAGRTSTSSTSAAVASPGFPAARCRSRRLPECAAPSPQASSASTR